MFNPTRKIGIRLMTEDTLINGPKNMREGCPQIIAQWSDHK